MSASFKTEPVTYKLELTCNKCQANWISPNLKAGDQKGHDKVIAKLVEQGWTVWKNKQTTFVYCPDHKPTAPMRRIYPPIEPHEPRSVNVRNHAAFCAWCGSSNFCCKVIWGMGGRKYYDRKVGEVFECERCGMLNKVKKILKDDEEDE